MTRLRHRFGRWLLRDAEPVPASLHVVVDAKQFSGELRERLRAAGRA